MEVMYLGSLDLLMWRLRLIAIHNIVVREEIIFFIKKISIPFSFLLCGESRVRIAVG